MKLEVDNELQELKHLEGLVRLWEDCPYKKAELVMKPSTEEGNVLISWRYMDGFLGHPYRADKEKLRNISGVDELKSLLWDYEYIDYLADTLWEKTQQPLVVLPKDKEDTAAIYEELKRNSVTGIVSLRDSCIYSQGLSYNFPDDSSPRDITKVYSDAHTWKCRSCFDNWCEKGAEEMDDSVPF
jgi:hypothetical protein